MIPKTKKNKPLRIMLGISSTEGLEKMIKAGVEELYCGYVPKSWRKKYGFFISPNRRAYERSNFKTINEVKEVLKIAHQHNVPMYMALNALIFIQDQYPLLKEIIEDCLDIGIRGFIVSDLGILLLLERMKLNTEIHISAVGVALNSQTINFYKALGATRINLSRHLTIKEIGEIALNNHDCELETFIWGSGCLNIDGLCTFKHGFTYLEDRIPSCYQRKYWRSQVIPRDKPISFTKRQTIIKRFKRPFRGIACGACALYDFARAGIHSIKVVKRLGNPLSEQLRDIKFIKRIKELSLNKSLSRDDFIKEVKGIYTSFMGERCRYSCYYYDERFKK